MAEPNNRLVPRYRPSSRVEITWTAEDRSKQLIRRKHPTTSVTAAIIDVSVNGMYVELPAEPRAQEGDVVALMSDDKPAAARVVRASFDREKDQQLVGVEITDMSREFADDLHGLVAALRGDRGQLAEWWQRR